LSSFSSDFYLFNVGAASVGTASAALAVYQLHFTVYFFPNPGQVIPQNSIGLPFLNPVMDAYFWISAKMLSPCSEKIFFRHFLY
jgi:hypothetical protein